MRNRTSPDGLALRPWALVARRYTEITGEQMTLHNAHRIGRAAEKKLVELIAKHGILTTGEIVSKYNERWTNAEIAADSVSFRIDYDDDERPTILYVLGVKISDQFATDTARDLRRALRDLLDEVRPAQTNMREQTSSEVAAFPRVEER